MAVAVIAEAAHHIERPGAFALAQGLADGGGNIHLGWRRRGNTHRLQAGMQQAFQRAVGDVIGTGLVELHRQRGLRHQRRALGNLDDALVNLLDLRHLRRADEIQHLRLRLHDIGRNAAAIGHRIMHARRRDNVLAQILHADIHQLDRVQRAAAEMRRIGGVRGNALKMKGDLIIGERAQAHDGVCR